MTNPDGDAVEVLVVEDDDLVMNVIERTLRHAGYVVNRAANATEGLAAFGANASTLRAVYLDLSLPDLPGAEVLSRLRASAPTMPVVLSSGFDPRGISNATLASATVFLQKPFRGGELLDAMRKAIGH